MRACLIPPAHFLTNKAPYLAFVDEDPRAEAACLAILNSLAFDWQARRFVEINLNFFVLEGLRVPELDEATLRCDGRGVCAPVVPRRALRGLRGRHRRRSRPLDDEQRAMLRAEIDARVARAWGLDARDLEVVFRDFTLDAVSAAYRERVRARFAELA